MRTSCTNPTYVEFLAGLRESLLVPYCTVPGNAYIVLETSSRYKLLKSRSCSLSMFVVWQPMSISQFLSYNYSYTTYTEHCSHTILNTSFYFLHSSYWLPTAITTSSCLLWLTILSAPLQKRILAESQGLPSLPVTPPSTEARMPACFAASWSSSTRLAA